MYMIRYWTLWNYTWYLGAELDLLPFNGALRTSIINTSIIGGFMTYIYPRKVVWKTKHKRYELPYYQIIILDSIFHQLPLIRLLYCNYSAGTCGLYTIAPALCWVITNTYNEIDLDKIYGIKMTYLYLGSAILTSIFGIVQHQYMLKK